MATKQVKKICPKCGRKTLEGTIFVKTCKYCGYVNFRKKPEQMHL